MFELINVTKSYGAASAVRGLSFSAETAKVYGLLGPNGAGKSTTLRLIAGLIPADAGEIRIGGSSIDDPRSDTKAKIGYLGDQPTLSPRLSVREEMEYAAGLHGLFGVPAREETERLLELFGLQDLAKKPVSALSKGQSQRLGAACAMVASPELLLLDEPYTGLDPEEIVRLRKILRAYGQEHTVLLSTHILQEAAASCDEILFLADGRLAGDPVSRDSFADADALEKIYLARAAAVKEEDAP